jgi:polygalacturonase
MLLAFILACCGVCSSGDLEQQEPLGNLKNPTAVKEVVEGKRKVANAAWWGFDEIDSTEPLQSAINSGASKVTVPNIGNEWIVRPIKLVSNQEIVFEKGVIVTAKQHSFKNKIDCLFAGFNLSNVTLRGYGATLKMRKKDYMGFRYIRGEWRHVIAFWGSDNIKILGFRVEGSGGDGIHIGTSRDKLRIPCKNVLIKDCVCDNNYRQGISVISVEKLRIDNCTLSNTKGTPPAAGIDLEPDFPKDKLIDIVISHCISYNNDGPGFTVNTSKLSSDSNEVSVLFVDCSVNRGNSYGLRVKSTKSDTVPDGLIEFKNCKVENTPYPGIYVMSKITSPINILFSDCILRNVATKNRSKFPIRLKLKKESIVNPAGDINFVNCSVYDKKNRPFLKISEYENAKGVYNVNGSFNVYSPYEARFAVESNERMQFQVRYHKLLQ